MRRLLFAVGTLGAVLVLAAAPAWAVKSGDNCSAADAQAGTVITGDTGATLKCVANPTGLPQWTTIVGATTNATTAPAVTTTTVAATAAAAPTGMATT